MAKVDKYSKTAYSTADAIAANSLPENVANNLETTVSNNPSDSVDNTFLFTVNPNISPLDVWAKNKAAGQTYANVLKKNASFSDVVGKGTSQIVMAGLEYAPDVATNLIGLSMAVSDGDFKNKDVGGAVLSSLWNGTDIGQIVNNGFQGLGDDWFVNPESIAGAAVLKERAKIFGWDAVDQYGTPTLGAQAAYNLSKLNPNSFEAKSMANIVDTAAFGLEFLSLNMAGVSLKSAGKLGKLAASSALKEVGEIGKLSKASREAQAILDTDAATRAKLGDGPVDVLDDVPEAKAAMIKGAERIQNDLSSEGVETGRQAAIDAIADGVDPLIRDAEGLNRINSSLEIEKMRVEGKVKQAEIAWTERLDELNNAEATQVTRIQELNNALASGTLPPESVQAVNQELIQVQGTLNNIAAERNLLNEIGSPVPTKATEEVAPKVYDSKFESQNYKADIIDTIPPADFVKENLSPERIKEFYDYALKNSNENSLRTIGSHPNTSADILVKLSESKNSYISDGVVNVARNTSTSPKTLSSLSKVGNKKVLINVATNPNTPRKTIGELLYNSNKEVRTAAYYNPNIDDVARAELDAQSFVDGRLLPVSMLDGIGNSINRSDVAEAAFQKARVELNIPKSTTNRILDNELKGIDEASKVQAGNSSKRAKLNKIIIDSANKFATDNGIDLKSAIKTYDGAVEFLKDSAGMRNGIDGRKLVVPEKFLSWLMGSKFEHILDTMVFINNASETIVKAGGEANAFGKMYDLLRGQIPSKYVVLLTQAKNVDEMKVILAEAYSTGNITNALRNRTLLAWQSRMIDPATGEYKAVGSFNPQLKEALSSFENTSFRFVMWINDKSKMLTPATTGYNTLDAEEMIQAVNDMVAYAFKEIDVKQIGPLGREAREFRQAITTRMANAKGSEDRRVVWTQAQEELVRWYGKHYEIPEDEMVRMIDSFKSVRKEEKDFNKKAAQFDYETSVKYDALTDDQKEIYSLVQALYHMNYHVGMIDPRDLSAMFKKRKSIMAIEADIKASKVKSAVYKTTRFVDDLYGNVFKRIVLGRFGYIFRNVLETQIRMFLKGHPSHITNPATLIGAIAAGGKGFDNRIISMIQETAKKTFANPEKLPGSVLDINGNPFGGHIEDVFKEIDDANKKLTEYKKAYAKLEKENPATELVTDKNGKTKSLSPAQEELASLRADIDELEAQIDELTGNSMVEQLWRDNFLNNTSLGEVTKDGDIINRSGVQKKYPYVWIYQDKAEFKSSFAAYVLRIASDDAAKDVLRAAKGLPAREEVSKFVKDNGLEKLTPQEQVIEYYSYGPGIEALTDLSKTNDMNAQRLLTNGELDRDKVAEFLFSETKDYSYYYKLGRFTNNFEDEFANVILRNEYRVVNADGTESIVRYPMRGTDSKDIKNKNYKKNLEMVENAYSDLIDEWAETTKKAIRDGADPKSFTSNGVYGVPMRDVEATWEGKNDIVKGLLRYSDFIFDSSAKMEKVFAHVPEYKYSYWDYIAQNIAMLSKADADKIIAQAAESLTVSKLIPSRWANRVVAELKRNSKASSTDSLITLKDIDEAAQVNAAKTIRETFYQAHKRNALAHQLRLIHPFIQPAMNTYITWSKLAAKNPMQLAKANLMYQYLSSEASSWINDLMLLEESEPNQPFLFNDPQTGEKMFIVPILSPLTQALMGQSWTMKLGSLSMIGALNTGPALQIPFDIIKKTMPAVYNMVPDWTKDMVFPLGENTDIMSAFTPSWFMQIIGYEENLYKYVPSAMNNLYAKNPEKYNGEGMPTPDEAGMLQLVNDAKVVGAGLSIGRGFLQLFSAGSLKPEMLYKNDTTGEVFFQSFISAEYHDLMSQGIEQPDAINLITNKYGQEATILMATTSKSGYLPTDDAWKAVQDDPSLLDVSPGSLPVFFTGGGFSREYYDMLNGADGKLSPDEYARNVNKVLLSAQSAELDRKLVNKEINQEEWEAGKKNLTETQKRTNLPAGNWNYSDLSIYELEIAMRHPKVAATESGQAFAQYNAYRKSAILSMGGERFDSEKNYQTRMQLFNIGIQLVEQYPEFAVMWYGALRYEVRPLYGELKTEGVTNGER